jgi:Tfp pilus assembly protein PilX
MEKLTVHPRPFRPSRRPLARTQRGDIMLVTMVFLLVCLLGLVVSMREGIVSTLMNGNNLARQRDVQVSDIATRQAEGLVQGAAGGMPLQISAFTQPWMRIGAATSVFAPPDASYWDACLGNSDSTLRCGSITPTVNGVALGYTALMVVQYTGRGRDPYSCQTATSTRPQTATYYDVFLHVKEANGVTSSDTHTVYRLCT